MIAVFDYTALCVGKKCKIDNIIEHYSGVKNILATLIKIIGILKI